MAVRSTNGTGGGFWDLTTTSTWLGGIIPDPATDTVVQQAGDQLTIRAAITVGNASTNGTTVLTLNGSALTVTGAGSLTLKGNVVESAAVRNVVFQAGSSLIFDASGSAGSARNTWAYQPYTQFFFSGSSGSRGVVSSVTASSAKAGAFIDGGSGAGGWVTSEFFDWSNIGDSTLNAWTTLMNHNYLTSTAWNFIFRNNTTNNCGGFQGQGLSFTTGSTWEVSNHVATNTQDNIGSNRFVFYLGPLAGVPWTFTGNRLDRPPLFFTSSTGTITGNVFGGSFVASDATAPWTTFDSNTVRITSAFDQLGNLCGPATNNFFYYDDPTRFNGHIAPVIPNLNASAIDLSGNVLYSNATDHGTRGFLTDDTAVACSVTIRKNIVLSNAVDAAASDFVSILNNASNIALTIEHNTLWVEKHIGLPIESVSTATAGRVPSVKGNLFIGSTGNPAGSGTTTFAALATDGTSQAVADIIPAANIAYNASHAVSGTATTAITNQGSGFALKFSAPFSPTGEQNLATLAFKNASVTDVTWNALQAWDAEIRGVAYASGSESSAKAGLIAGTSGYTTAAFLSFVRDAYRPTTPATAAFFDSSHAFPGDTTTGDAAGNSIGGTVGAMAFISANTLTYSPGDETSFLGFYEG